MLMLSLNQDIMLNKQPVSFSLFVSDCVVHEKVVNMH